MRTFPFPKNLFRFCENFNSAAENFGVRISRLAEKIFIIRTYREERRVYFAQSCGKSYELISAQIQLYYYVFAVKFGNGVFYRIDAYVCLNHIINIA